MGRMGPERVGLGRMGPEWGGKEGTGREGF